MKKEERIVGMLGLAAKSGNILTGQKAVKKYISSPGKKEEKLVIFASNYGQSVEAVLKKCKMHGVLYVKLKMKKDELGKCLGRREISVIAITDRGFVNGIKDIISA